MIRFLLVRHGQSTWNAVGKWQGQADPPLTELGLAQAHNAAARLPVPDLLAASTLQRAHQTAQQIGAALGIDQIELDADLVERDAGQFSGLTKDEIEVQFPGYLGNDIWPDGWEDDEPLVARVAGAVHRLAATVDDGQTIVAVSHGGCIYALERALGASFERISNLGGRWFSIDPALAPSADDAAATPMAGISLGERVHLLDAADETVPDQI